MAKLSSIILLGKKKKKGIVKVRTWVPPCGNISYTKGSGVIIVGFKLIDNHTGVRHG